MESITENINNKLRYANHISSDKRHRILLGDGVAVLIPCYNEEMTIRKVVEDFNTQLPLADIYVYDNASTDRTSEVLSDTDAIICYESRRGKGNVVRSMFRDIDADYYILVDGDDTYPAESVKELLIPLVDNKADMTVGDRLSNGTYSNENKRKFHNFGNNLVRHMIRLIYHYDYKDVMTGYRGFTKLFIKTFPVTSDGFQIETELSIHAVDKKWRIEEIPVIYRDRPEGSYSKLDTIGDGTNVIRAIVSLFKEYRPFAFFGWVSILFFIVGLILGVPIIIEFFNTGLVPRFPTAILTVGIMLCGVLSLTAGTILDSLSKSNRKDWELFVYQMIFLLQANDKKEN